MRLRRILVNPWAYGAWLAFLVVAFLASYYSDPYAYGFTVLGLAWVSSLVVVCACVAVVLGLRAGRTAGALWIGTATIGIVAATVTALAILKTFKWA
jgi:hypothetical protein